MVSHYVASGWLDAGDADEGLIDLVSQGALEGYSEPLPDRTEYRVLADPGHRFELWLYAAFGQVRGAVPYVRGNVEWQVVIDRTLPRVTGGMGAVELHRVEDPDRSYCVELPDFGKLLPTEMHTPLAMTCTGLAYLCRTIPVPEEPLCMARVYPFGMLNDPAVSAGEGSRCDVLLCGRIRDASLVTNPLTSLMVWLITLDVGGVPLSVAAPPAIVEGDRPAVGRLFEGVFWLTGRLVRARESGLLRRTLQRFTRGAN